MAAVGCSYSAAFGRRDGLASKHRIVAGLQLPHLQHPRLQGVPRQQLSPQRLQTCGVRPAQRCWCTVSAAASSSYNAAAGAPEQQQQLLQSSRAVRIVLGAVTACWHALVGAVKAAAAQGPDPASVNTTIKQSVRHFHMLGVIAPFAAASSGANTFLLLTKAMAKFIKIYLLLLFLRVLLSWFPAFNWERQPWLALRQMTDPYLNLYRGLVPPLLGTIDFTPLLGFFILQYLSGVLESGASEDELDEWW